MSAIKITNEQFLAAVFPPGFPGTVVVAGFSEDPASDNAKWTARPLLNCKVPADPAGNTYYSTSTYRHDGKSRTLERVKAGFVACGAIILDDIGEKIDPETIGLEPSYKLETSPDNEQWGYLLAEPCQDVALIESILKALAGTKSDPSGNNLVRWARLPDGHNTKACHIEFWGGFFPHVMHSWRPDLRYTPQQIIEGLALEIGQRNQKQSQRDFGGFDPVAAIRAILAAESYHDNLRDLAARLVAKGHGKTEAVAMIQGWMNAARPHDARWQARYDDIARLVQSAMDKGFGPVTLEDALAESQKMDESTTPDEIEDLVRKTEALSPIAQRKVFDEIKKRTRMPLSVLKELKNSLKGDDPEGGTDQLALARRVVNALGGTDNLITSMSFTWVWDGSGVWRRLEKLGTRKLVQAQLDVERREPVDRQLVTDVTDLFQTEVYRHDHQFNVGPPECVNCRNGEIHLIDGADWVLLPHNRDHYRTAQIPVSFDAEAKAPRFAQFLQEVFAGDRDHVEKSRAVLEMIGYTLMAHCRHERFVILVGSGANGKSVLLAVLEALLGRENVAGVQPSMFDRTFQRAHLLGKLANIVTEIKQGEVIDDASLKGIVSGEPTTVECKFKDPFTMRPFATCWFGTNHMPHTRDFSDALFRRALILAFNRVFKPELGNCDPKLKDALMTELPGILNMALDAYASALTFGFTMPPSSRDARDEWRLEADQVAQFVDEMCARDKGGKIEVGVLHRAYGSWADDQGIYRKLAKKGFRDRLTKLGFGASRDSTARYVDNIRLRGTA